jgi:hypothetical protein
MPLGSLGLSGLLARLNSSSGAIEATNRMLRISWLFIVTDSATNRTPKRLASWLKQWKKRTDTNKVAGGGGMLNLPERLTVQEQDTLLTSR